jgi:hypothetical protein
MTGTEEKFRNNRLTFNEKFCLVIKTTGSNFNTGFTRQDPPEVN